MYSLQPHLLDLSECMYIYLTLWGLEKSQTHFKMRLIIVGFFLFVFKLIKHNHSTLEKEKSKEIIKGPKLP